ncbi:glucose-6-phosphate isomerase [Vreelandella alkaliphila]|uniref:glucose-6-phosphate isomerase n=1 Tax=Vreelandella alkaliphila TaxID=272774 RepID=UPI000EA28174|nr:glucose-6-phosphate isomerase [Halomonas alkaliphila]AYF34613.1 glucose-6-phosphate isomerase [Halomonas alkaliphila]
MNSPLSSATPRVYTPVSELHVHAEHLQAQSLSDLLGGSSTAAQQRANALAFTFGSLHIDLSKQRLTTETIELLTAWAESCGLTAKRQALFAGEQVNTSERRAALHMAARWPSSETPPEGMESAAAFCQHQRARMAEMVERVHNGKWYGATGQAITDIVHIGVGGSDLGPKLISEALADRPSITKVNVHYVSTMDGAQLLPLMECLNPATTLLVLASKSFTTADTQFNVRTALAWLSHALEVDEATVCRYQLIGVSSKPEKMTEFGIPESQQLVFKEWIGGRFSLWSPIGISVAMQLGLECFDALLEGAHAMDKHFLEAPLASNLPVLMALVGAWNSQFLNIPTHAVLPYDGRLKSLAAYLQQLEMESNGKSVGLDGRSVSHATCPILWGDVGPNGQHAFYQLLHQGSHTVSADFVAVTQRPVAACEKVSRALEAQEQLTLAHCLAQSQLFALGDDAIPPVLRGYMAQGYRGNQPNSVVLLKTLDAWSIGALLALYEHKVFVQSVLWNLNPFDQPGVELGKRLATSLYQTLANEPVEHQNVEDPSTAQLLHKVNEWRKQRNDKGSS